MTASPQNQSSQRNFDFISLPEKKAKPEKPIGHHRLRGVIQDPDYFSGKLFLCLTTEKPVTVGSGVTVMGTDVADLTRQVDPRLTAQIKNIHLFKASVQRDRRLVIPGSSLKGVVRSVYEAITGSCLCKTKADRTSFPQSYKECSDKNQLCPACLVFGAMNWQGLIHFTDAQADAPKFRVGKIPTLHSPKAQAVDPETGEKIYFDNDNQIRGRKFYPHTYSNQAQPKINIQRSETGQSFKTSVRCMNLTLAQMGTLLLVLGQDKNNPFKLKVGGGKSVGMGSVSLKLTNVEQLNYQRYLSYSADSNLSNSSFMSDEEFMNLQGNTMIATALQHLVKLEQLNEVKVYLQ